MQQSYSFTVKANGGLLRELRTSCGVAQAFNPNTPGPHPELRTFHAVWDTGAMGSVVTQKVVDECGLKPTGMKEVRGVHSQKMCPTFLINLQLPQGVGFVGVPVVLGEMGQVDVLIGMDIINRGDFAITNVGGLTVFSFRVPSVKTIDFVKEHHVRAEIERRSQQRTQGFQGHPHRRGRKHK